MDYYIFRHGETFSSIGRDSGYGDKQLTTGILPEGHDAIKRMAEYLKNIPTDHNVISELKRVQETAEIISKITGKVFENDSRLNEMLDENNIEPPYPFTGYLEKKIQMLKSFLVEMNEKNFNSILIGTHGFPIAGLKHLILDGEFHLEQLHDYPRPGILTIIKDKTLEEIDFN